MIEWLPQNIPDNDESSIVHGDYRVDNVIVHPTEPKIIGILDWELSTIGHPLGDFTYNLLSWQMPDIGIGSGGLFGQNIKELGIPSEEEYIDSYCERRGVSRGLEDREFYSAYNFFDSLRYFRGLQEEFAMELHLMLWLKV